MKTDEQIGQLFQADFINWLYNSNNHITYYEGKSKTIEFFKLWELGYKSSQSEMYSEEDMFNLSAYVVDIVAGRKVDFMKTTPQDVAKSFIQSLKNKQ